MDAKILELKRIAYRLMNQNVPETRARGDGIMYAIQFLGLENTCSDMAVSSQAMKNKSQCNCKPQGGKKQ